MTEANLTTEMFNQILVDEWEARMQADPLFATSCGDHRYDDRLPDVSEAGYARWLQTIGTFRQRLAVIDVSELAPADRLNHAILSRLLADEQNELIFHSYRLPISKTSGYYSSFAETLPFIMPFETTQDYENYLQRLVAFPRYSEQNLEVMRTGLDTGYLPPEVTLQGIDESIRKMIVSDPTESMLFNPFKQIPDSISLVDHARLSNMACHLIKDSVFPALQLLLEFVQQEYIPGARQTISAAELPDGSAFYRHRIRRFTSLDLTPEQVHRTGQEEVRRIHAEMQSIIKAVGFQGDFKSFIHFLRSDPRFYVDTPGALLKETSYVLKRMDGELPHLFGILPRTPYGIREIPAPSAPASTAAYYFPSTGDGRTGGYYYVNTYDLKSRPLYEIEALSLHEAVPGHHLQLALQQELDLPPFRRFNGFTSFVEGWALYAERLGLETGFYTDPYSNFGRLSYEMWRACRLVVDTGMHALGWTRQQAIDFMADNTSSTLLNITNEVDRYIAWPGQALAYKIGELKIRALRAHAEQALGDKFNLRAFHDMLLGSGAVPLDILEQMVEAWIKGMKPLI